MFLSVAVDSDARMLQSYTAQFRIQSSRTSWVCFYIHYIFLQVSFVIIFNEGVKRTHYFAKNEFGSLEN